MAQRWSTALDCERYERFSQVAAAAMSIPLCEGGEGGRRARLAVEVCVGRSQHVHTIIRGTREVAMSVPLAAHAPRKIRDQGMQ